MSVCAHVPWCVMVFMYKMFSIKWAVALFPFLQMGFSFFLMPYVGV